MAFGIRKYQSMRKKYGFTLKRIASMYGLTYYRVWTMHTAGELSEYIATHSPDGKSK